MPARSAGVLAFRRTARGLEVLLVHPGGPFWRNKDLGAWSIPKGEFGPGEQAEAVARREFAEELGTALTMPLRPLGEVRQRGGKIVEAFAAETDLDADAIASNEFELEWPPRSGRMQRFPEVDRAAWFDLAEARTRINSAQIPLLDRLAEIGGG
ncbi:NUDIX domain-containing protein [Bradyrhizobium sp. 83002]|uniref:NUDIX domain-containing protein n=1 Tax=Bradyrhizobium aeschynomenes TaxID=2734909 RepID=UPI001552FE2E|nr:NUDIX domain-containing protein [Bradyrhizobium aeschynomenes]NPU12071.1 NUDIX domain-containing protein [Bradyrhizobium aeschynomenes]NPV22053.1 NUDIX domain-containing protein [Bradyrhizobium aeschynomenes]